MNFTMDDFIDVEYIGDPNPLDEVMKAKIAMGMIPRAAANVIRGAAIKRSKAIKTVNIRIVDQKTFGTSMDYTFGPKSFVTKMKVSDYQKVKETTSAHQFRRVGDPLNNLILPRHGEDNINFVNVKEMDSSDILKLKQSIQASR